MIYLLTGSNLGNRTAVLDEARRRLEMALGVNINATQVLETEAIGFDGPAFLNQVLFFESQVEPHALLKICQGIEIEMGRPEHQAEYDEDGRRIYHSRIIDIDILIFNDIKLNEERLVLPHPQVRQRHFAAQLLEMAGYSLN